MTQAGLNELVLLFYLLTAEVIFSGIHLARRVSDDFRHA